jgi:hypothetical protein
VCVVGAERCRRLLATHRSALTPYTFDVSAMEQSMVRPFDGQVAVLFGRNSHLNPFNQPDADPHATFRAAYRNGYTVRLIDGARGQFFDSPNIETFAATLAALLDGELDTRTDTGAT